MAAAIAAALVIAAARRNGGASRSGARRGGAAAALARVAAAAATIAVVAPAAAIAAASVVATALVVAAADVVAAAAAVPAAHHAAEEFKGIGLGAHTDQTRRDRRGQQTALHRRLLKKPQHVGDGNGNKRVSPEPPAPRGTWHSAAAVSGNSATLSPTANPWRAESKQCYRRRGLPGFTERQGRVAFRQLAGPLGRSLPSVSRMPHGSGSAAAQSVQPFRSGPQGQEI